jgi:transcriptional regulator with XRE-family HTH domain
LLVALGAALRKRRRDLGISQEDLALRAEIDRAYVGGLERGEHNPTLVTLERLSAALDVRMSALLFGVGY